MIKPIFSEFSGRANTSFVLLRLDLAQAVAIPAGKLALRSAADAQD